MEGNKTRKMNTEEALIEAIEAKDKDPETYRAAYSKLLLAYLTPSLTLPWYWVLWNKLRRKR
jgi:hypothetical protein